MSGSGFSDEQLSGWLDHGLDSEGMAQMDKLVAGDPELARQSERLRHLDGLVRAAVPAEEAIPEALLERLGLAAPAPARVIDLAAERARRAAAPPPARRLMPAVPSRIAAGLAAVIGIGLGALALSDRPGAVRPDYAVLGDAAHRAAPATANAVVIFAPGVAPARARVLATGAGARIVAGPSSTGTWQIAINPGQRAGALAELRSHREVTLAEPLDGAVR